MSREVRGQYLKDKFKYMSKRELASYIQKRRFTDLADWWTIANEVGVSDKSLRRIMRQEGLEPNSKGGAINPHNATRNDLIIKTFKEYAERREPISQQGIADIVTRAGFPVNRGTVNGVIDRAREQALLPKAESVVPLKRRVNYAFVGNFSGPGKPEGLPPRTPELLSRGRVSYDALGHGMCRYTPSEEAPFFFCGEAVTDHRSWCNDCYENIIRRPVDPSKEASTQRASNALAA